jgi:hypothetical protein
VTDTEKVPGSELRGFAGQLVSIFILAGIVILLCIVAGLGFAGFRILRRKVLHRDDPDAMTVLNIHYSLAKAGPNGGANPSSTPEEPPKPAGEPS